MSPTPANSMPCITSSFTEDERSQRYRSQRRPHRRGVRGAAAASPWPSRQHLYRDLERWGREHATPLPRSTLIDVLAGRRLPRKPLLRTFLAACGVDTTADGRWESAWNRLAEQQPSTVHPTPATAGDTASDAWVAAARAQAEQITAGEIAGHARFA
ncbi:hypothetical protein ACN27G_28715 [Plantactinospora sp. WMMB334]|uniref:hypothetical protein n=1 Tax=Plantactinospora sp. WMMB334 TaxID=3404119 RepID=UPI003B943C25